MISNTWYVGVLWASILVLGQQKPRDTAVEITNDFSICLLQVIATPKSNAIFSPYGLVSVSVLIYEGANHSSQSSQQIERALRLPANSNTTQMGFRDLHMTMRASKYFTSDGFLRGLVLSNPKAVLHRSYLEKLKYYGFEPDVSSILTTTTMVPTTTAMPANKTTEKEVINKTTTATTKPPTTTTKPTTELSGEDASTATSGAGSGSMEELTTTPPTDASVESKDGRADLDTTTVPSTMRTTTGDSSTNAEEGSTEGSGSTETENSREPLTEAPTNITTTPVPPTTGIKKSTTVDQDEVSMQTPEVTSEESASTDAAYTDNTDAASTEAASTSGSSEGGGGDDSNTSASTADDTTTEDASQIPEQKTEASGITVANAMVSMLEAQQPETSTMMIDNQVTTVMDTVAVPTTSSADVTTPSADSTTSSADGATSSSDITTSSADSATSNSDAPATESVVTERTTLETTTVPAEITTETTTTPASPVEETTATLLDAVTISPPSMREANEIEEKLGQLKALITSSLKENAKRLGILSKFEKFKQLDEEHEKRLGTFSSVSSSVNSSTTNDTENDDVLSKMSIKTLFSDWVTIVPALSGSNEDYNYPFEESTEEKTVSTTDDDIFGQSRDNKPPTTVRDREYEDYVSGGIGEDLLMTSSRRGEASILEAKKREVVGVGVGAGGNANATKNITKRSISGRLRMADWGQDNALYRVPPTQWFYTFSGQRMVPVLTLSAFLPFADLPTLGAQAIQIPLDAEFYTLLILIPKHRLGLKQLMYALQWCPLTGIIASLRTTPVYTVVPTFTMVTHINLVNPLMKLGIRDIFDQQRADLSEMSPDPNLFVRSVEQVITISVRKYYNTHYRWIDASPSQVQHHVLAMHPFIFFVVDTETKVALVSGTMVDPTLWSQEQHPGY